MAEPIVSLMDVNKKFGSNHVVKNLSLSINEGEFLTLLGPSGCGKTTTLRMIAGFEDATSGIIKVEGERVEDKEAYERNVNTVFQSYALFPHMTVYDNVAYGLTVKKTPKVEIKRRVKQMLELVQLSGYEKRKPDAMSGGQKQRVAIARALINNPKVLLLDEPLGALDLKLRKQMQLELKRLQKKLNITFIYVTHDQEEALSMSDRIAILNAGVLEQIGTTDDIYEKPKTRFVADFIGESNIFNGTVKVTGNGKLEVETENGMLSVRAGSFLKDERIFISVRPEDLKVSLQPVEGFSISAIIKDFIYVGAQFKTNFSLKNGEEIKMSRHKAENYKEGDEVYVYWNLDDAVAIKYKNEALDEKKHNHSQKISNEGIAL